MLCVFPKNIINTVKYISLGWRMADDHPPTQRNLIYNVIRNSEIIMEYICPKCGEEHESWPILTFKTPDFYAQLSEQEKKDASLSSDLCVIHHNDQTDRFIRCIMVQKVNTHCQDLEYGLWVSVSEKSYQDYIENVDNETHKVQYFGWLSNWITEYGKFVWIKMHIAIDNTNTQPPKAFVQIVNDPDIPFVRDYFQGIPKEAAQARVDRHYTP